MAVLLRFRTHVIPDVLRWVGTRGGDPALVLARAGYPADAAQRPWIDAPIEVLHRFFDEAALAANDPLLGLHVGSEVRRETWDIIQVSCRSAPTLGAALLRIPELMPLFNDAIDVTVQTGATWRVTHRVVGMPEGLSLHGNELWLAALLTRARAAIAAGPNLAPVECWFGHRAPADLAPRAAFFGTARLAFGAGSTGLAFAATDVERALITADPVLSGMLDRLAAEALARAGGGRRGVAAKVYRELMRLLPDAAFGSGGPPKLEAVARALGMSTRSLQRALNDETVSYRELIEQVRRDEALILERAGMPAADIALRLGYAETASYTRARARWRD